MLFLIRSGAQRKHEESKRYFHVLDVNIFIRSKIEDTMKFMSDTALSELDMARTLFVSLSPDQRARVLEISVYEITKVRRRSIRRQL